MPMDREHVLRILSQQDSLADIAEDVCVLLTMKPIRLPDELKGPFQRYRELSVKSVELAGAIIAELDELVGGPHRVVFAIFDDHNAGASHNPEGNLAPFQSVFAAQPGGGAYAIGSSDETYRPASHAAS